MRQGPNYSMWVNRWHEIADGREGNEEIFLRLPVELSQEWEGFSRVVWTDNGDGTYTLTPTER